MAMAEEAARGRSNGGWHLDKGVPIAIIVTLLVQTAGALIWAGAISQRILTLEAGAQNTAKLAERVVRVEVQTEAIADGIQRIERKLDQPGNGQ